jgi:hypothetical protein
MPGLLQVRVQMHATVDVALRNPQLPLFSEGNFRYIAKIPNVSWYETLRLHRPSGSKIGRRGPSPHLGALFARSPKTGHKILVVARRLPVLERHAHHFVRTSLVWNGTVFSLRRSHAGPAAFVEA